MSYRSYVISWLLVLRSLYFFKFFSPNDKVLMLLDNLITVEQYITTEFDKFLSH